MKKILIILALILLGVLGFLAFPIAINLLKALIGVGVIVLIGIGVVIGRISKK